MVLIMTVLLLHTGAVRTRTELESPRLQNAFLSKN